MTCVNERAPVELSEQATDQGCLAILFPRFLALGNSCQPRKDLKHSLKASK